MEDIVKVVKCKDCIHFERKSQCHGYCYYWDYEQGMSPNTVENDDYCSNGEIKD